MTPTNRTDREPHANTIAPSEAAPLVTGTPAGKVLVAFCCFNEELAISGLVLRARRHAQRILVVDDGSSDKTAENASLAGAIVLQHASNLGKGVAVRTAMRFASANDFDALVLLDGDGQHDPDEIPLVLAPLVRQAASTDLAFGFRYGERTDMPAYRRVGKRVLDYATAITTATEVTDSQCGFRAFNRRAIKLLADTLRAERFAVESETIAIIKQNGLKWENVPVHCRYEGIDGSTETPVRHGVDVLNHVFVLLTMRRPLLTVGLPGIGFCMAGAYYAIQMLQIYDREGTFLVAYALAAGTLAILGGIMVATALMLNMLILMRRSLGDELHQRHGGTS